MPQNQLCPLKVQEERSRSVSPLPITRCREFINDLSRRFSRRSDDGVIFANENDSEFLSNSSCLRHSRKEEFNSNLEIFEISLEKAEPAEEWKNANNSSSRSYRRSLSAIQSALVDSAITTKNFREPTKTTKKDQSSQKKILRQPIRYTYLKGMSGLPTKRVPSSVICSQYSCRRRFLL